MSNEIIKNEVRRLITEGKAVIATKFDAGMGGVTYMGGRPTGVNLQPFSRWMAGCKNLMRMLSDAAEPWKAVFDGENSESNALSMLGTLEAIEQAIAAGLLISVEDLVRADSFSNLLDQADFLK